MPLVWRTSLSEDDSTAMLRGLTAAAPAASAQTSRDSGPALRHSTASFAAFSHGMVGKGHHLQLSYMGFCKGLP